MKILHTSDLHFNKKWFYWIKKEQENYDIFCIAGDFLDETKDESLTEQIQWVSQWMRGFKKPLFVCSGNHDIEDFDNEDWLTKIPNIYSDGSIKTIDNIKIGCIEYISPDFLEFCDCDIILYHIPPSKTSTSIHSKTKEDWGDRNLYKLIKSGFFNPKIVLTGHLHSPTKNIDKIMNTKIYNPGVSKDEEVLNYNDIVL